MEIHTTLATTANLEHPDQIVFDLDPMDENFEWVRKAALALHELLQERSVHAFVKTSGRKGLHVHVPIQPLLRFEAVKPWAKQIAHALCERLPVTTTEEHSRSKRGNRVYIDIERNNYAQTVVAPYSLRATANAAVSTPLDWSELRRRRVHAQSWTLRNLFRRLAAKPDPWEGFGAEPLDPRRLCG